MSASFELIPSSGLACAVRRLFLSFESSEYPAGPSLPRHHVSYSVIEATPSIRLVLCLAAGIGEHRVYFASGPF